MVLFHQRAHPAISKSALPPRLQHRASALVLAAASGVAISMELISAGSVPWKLQSNGPGGTRAPARIMLDSICDGFLYLFHHAGVLLHAHLSSFGFVAKLGYGGTRRVGRGGYAHPGRLSVGAALVIGTILFQVRGVSATGEFSSALAQHPELYTLSLGHVGDLTLRSLAYLRLPLAMAGVAFLMGATGLWIFRKNAGKAFFAAALMMVIFFHAARVAMVTFDPYLSSKPLADALLAAPPGELIEANAYYSFSSVFFYTHQQALLLNGRKNNLEYGSYAPDAPKVFIGDNEFKKLWSGSGRYYLLAYGDELRRLEEVVGRPAMYVVKESGGNYLVANQETN